MVRDEHLMSVIKVVNRIGFNFLSLFLNVQVTKRLDLYVQLEF